VLREFQSSYAICHQVVAGFGVCGETVQYGHDRATTHGFRAVASTILNETNLFNRDWIERQLSHVERTKYDAPTTLRSACLGWLTHILAQDLSLSRRDPETGLLSRFCEVEQGLDKRLNDGRVDARGRLWIGTRDNELHRPNDSLYCVDGNGAVTRMFGDVIVTNGIAFSPDNRLRRDPAPILRCQAARWRAALRYLESLRRRPSVMPDPVAFPARCWAHLSPVPQRMPPFPLRPRALAPVRLDCF
jgi:hypothetical protein